MIPQKIGCGLYHSASVDDEGNVWVMGRHFGVLENQTVDTFIPQKVPILREIEQVSCSLIFSCCVARDGGVWLFGMLPVQAIKRMEIPSSVEITTVACGFRHAICLSREGNCWGYGNNTYGELGLGHEESTEEPMQIDSLSNISSISAHGYSSLFLNNKGQVYGTGSNSHGQLPGVTTKTSIPVLIQGLPTVDMIAAGFSHSLFLSNRKVYGCGNNDIGQLGSSDKTRSLHQIQELPPIRFIQTGFNASYFIDDENYVWVSGCNSYYCLGTGDKKLVCSPTRIDLEGAYTISQGHHHQFVTLYDGRVFGIGRNANGQLGLGDPEDRSFPAQLENSSHIDTQFSARNKSARK